MTKDEAFSLSKMFLDTSTGGLMFGKERENVKRFVDKAYKIITSLENNKEPDYEKEDIAIELEKYLRLVRNYILYKDISEGKALSAIILIAKNLNDGWLRSSKVKDLIHVINRILSQHFTILEAIDILKKMISTAENILRRHPGQIMAKHYLDVLLKEDE